LHQPAKLRLRRDHPGPALDHARHVEGILARLHAHRPRARREFHFLDAFHPLDLRESRGARPAAHENLIGEHAARRIAFRAPRGVEDRETNFAGFRKPPGREQQQRLESRLRLDRFDPLAPRRVANEHFRERNFERASHPIDRDLDRVRLRERRAQECEQAAARGQPERIPGPSDLFALCSPTHRL